MQQPGLQLHRRLLALHRFQQHHADLEGRGHAARREHDPTDRAAAFARALEDPMALGIYYKNEKPTMVQQFQALKDAARADDVDELLDSYALNVKIAA